MCTHQINERFLKNSLKSALWALSEQKVLSCSNMTALEIAAVSFAEEIACHCYSAFCLCSLQPSLSGATAIDEKNPYSLPGDVLGHVRSKLRRQQHQSLNSKLWYMLYPIHSKKCWTVRHWHCHIYYCSKVSLWIFILSCVNIHAKRQHSCSPIIFHPYVNGFYLPLKYLLVHGDVTFLITSLWTNRLEE